MAYWHGVWSLFYWILSKSLWTLEGILKYVAQKSNYDCGPACISMVSGVPEKKVLDLLGKKFDKGLKPEHMKWVLDKLKVPFSGWHRDGLWDFSDKVILEYSFFNNNCTYVRGHYIVKYKNKYYDPAYGVRREFINPLAHPIDWVKIDRYLVIYD